jgi:hypothetical protein
MKSTKFISKSRIAISLIVAAIFVFMAMNFNPRNINILATRSTIRIIVDYALNIALFFVIFYLLTTLAVFLYKKIFKNSSK